MLDFTKIVTEQYVVIKQNLNVYISDLARVLVSAPGIPQGSEATTNPGYYYGFLTVITKEQ